MPAARQNNIQSKIEAIKDMPSGVSFDQEKTWQNLELSLRSGNFRKRPVRIALVFLTLLTAAFFILLRPTHTSQSFVKAQPPKQIEMQTTGLETKNKTANIDDVEAVNDGKASKLRSQQNQNIISQEDSVSNLQVQSTLPPAQPPPAAQQQQIDSIRVEDSLVKIAISIPPKPKYKTAHVNELYPKSAQPFASSPSAKEFLAMGEPPALELPELEGLNPKEKALILKRKKILTALMSASQ